jgi:hypothetical protein
LCGVALLLFLLLKPFNKTKGNTNVNINLIQENEDELINPHGNTLQTRISPPPSFQRINHQNGTFSEYLRQLPMKPHNSEVKLYDGSTKTNHNIYDAVVDLEIGNRNLHHCADAIMRLRAEYLWENKLYDKIHFNFTNGFRVDYSEWMKGRRIIVNGNSTQWTTNPINEASNTYNNFWKYMEIIFNYAGTLSLSQELQTIDINNMNIGDIFIQGGSPGHAVIVVDFAENSITQEKIFLLAQSYMPAQEIQILKNPNNESISPWYSVNFEQDLITPEWRFNRSDIKRFEE